MMMNLMTSICVKKLRLISLLVPVFLLVACQADEQKNAELTLEEKALAYDVQKAKKSAETRLSLTSEGEQLSDQGAKYTQIVISKNSSPLNLSDFLNSIASPETKKIVFLLKTQLGSDQKLPTIPLFIAQKGQQGAWENSFIYEGFGSPLIANEKNAFRFDLEIVLLNNLLKDIEADALAISEHYKTDEPVYAAMRGKQLSSASDHFLQRLVIAQERAFENVKTFQTKGETHDLFFDDGVGRKTRLLSLGLSEKPSLLGPLNDYNSILQTKVGAISPRKAISDLETAFWFSTEETYPAVCKAIDKSLLENLGLIKSDRTIVLRRMVMAFASFDQKWNNVENCLGSGATPVPEHERNVGIGHMISTLTQIAKITKNPSTSNEKRLQDLFENDVLIKDQSRLLWMDQTADYIRNQLEYVAPETVPEIAKDFLISLPIQSMGCFTKSFINNKKSRSSLVKLENDNVLWQLNVGFSNNKKIQSLFLKKASQKDFCHALSGRSAENQCAFAKKSFTNIDRNGC